MEVIYGQPRTALTDRLLKTGSLHSQRQSHFTTGNLPPISPSCRQASSCWWAEVILLCDERIGLSLMKRLGLCQVYTSGRAIAHAVSRRLPTAETWVQTRVWSFGDLWWTKVALGQVFSPRTSVSLPIYIPSAPPQSSSLSLEADTIGQEWPRCQ
jgi:hypothetical protein